MDNEKLSDNAVSSEPKENDASSDTVMKAAQLCGLLILENGGETSRAEETVLHVCRTFGYNETEVIAFPTGIIISMIRDGTVVRSSIQRVKKRTINLTKLNEVNTISRALRSGSIGLIESVAHLNALNRSSTFSKPLYALIAAAATACFALLYGGGIFDAAVAFICGGVVQYISSMFKRTDIYKFAISLIGGTVIALIAVTATTIFGYGSVDKIIVGAIIPLLPGLAMNSAIRDTMNGDLVSGSARLAEVALVALALAAGVGAVFAVFVGLGGTIRQM